MAKQKNRNYMITRAKYKAIKAYDHKQMEEFLTDVYKNGYKDGRDSVPGIDVQDVIQAISETKGIGEKKLAAIKESVEAVFERSGGDGVKRSE